jgi:hypothetical protein
VGHVYHASDECHVGHAGHIGYAGHARHVTFMSGFRIFIQVIYNKCYG